MWIANQKFAGIVHRAVLEGVVIGQLMELFYASTRDPLECMLQEGAALM